MAETLQSDPKLRGAMETIRQAQGDFVTSSLLPNPTVQVNGVFLPLRTFTPASPGGPPELDVIATFPIDWYLFGKRAAAMANAQIGVAVSNADYCDQVRQRLANTASAILRRAGSPGDGETRGGRPGEPATRRGHYLGRRQIRRFGDDRGRANSAFRARCPARGPHARRRRWRRTRPNCGPRSAAPGRSPQFEVAGSLEVAKPAAPISLSEAIAVAEQNRPDIISLRRQIAKARSGIEVERTKARPTVSPSLGYQYQFQECNGVADASSYTAQMNVSVPIFDRNQGNIAKAQSVLAQSCFNLQAQLVQAEADIEQAVGEFQAAQEQCDLDRSPTACRRAERPRSDRSRLWPGRQNAAGRARRRAGLSRHPSNLHPGPIRLLARPAQIERRRRTTGVTMNRMRRMRRPPQPARVVSPIGCEIHPSAYRDTR